MSTPFGALPSEWSHFALVLGLTPDLLPVVSNPHAIISPNSKMKGLGKTPSKYNNARQVGGIPGWTQFTSSADNVAQWSKEPDYGICLQTRIARALDCDITDARLAAQVHAEIDDFLKIKLPCRSRANSPKFLLAFTLEGTYPKRTIKTEHGMIEFLGTGSQFIAAGTHPSGERYTWGAPLPDEIPTLTPKRFNALWARLGALFAVEPPTTSVPARALKHSKVTQDDPIAKALFDRGSILAPGKDHSLHIVCPFAEGHSTDTGDSSTSYFPAHTGGFERGHFVCLHASCAGRTDGDFLEALGFDGSEDYEVMGSVPEAPQTTQRFRVQSVAEFTQGTPPSWLIKDLLPKAGLAVVFGDPGSGKSFFALDLAAAVARGGDWRGKRVSQGRAVYVCAEGAGGFRNRVKAYLTEHQLTELDVGIVPSAPNLMKLEDANDLLAAIKTYGEVSLIVVDTLAQAMPGANENSGEDVGKALAHCRALHHATGALVVLVHHSGKDATKGARGWSGLRAAADAEIAVTRYEQERVAQVTKQKDGEDGIEFGFKLRSVVVGVDADGDEVTSCVLEHAEVTPKALRKGGKRVGGTEALVMRTIANLVGLGDTGVTFNTLIEEVSNQLPFDAKTGKKDRRGEVVSRSIKGLVERGFLTSSDGKLSQAEGQ